MVLVDNGSATTCRANSWVLNAIVVDPVLASRIGIVRSDFHVVHVVHIAAHDGVGFGNLRSGLLAGAAGGVEEVDKHGLATVEDVEQMDFGAVAVGSREVDGCRERALRFQAKTKGQREDEGKYFFHRQLFNRFTATKLNNLLKCWLFNCLIVVDGQGHSLVIPVVLLLLVLQVLQSLRLHVDSEIPALVAANGNPVEAHLPAV